MGSKRLGVLVLVGMSSTLPGSLRASPRALVSPPTAYADLSVSMSDGRTALVGPGDETTYAITLSNAGPAPVFGAVLAGVLPPGLSGAIWGCLPQDDVSCAMKGSGDLSDAVDLPAGSSVTYFLTATLDEGAGPSVSNLVTVTPPADVVDPVSPNNWAVDVNGVGVTPSLSVSDVTVSLASSGPSTATLRVDLRSALPYGLTVDFTTADDSAVAGADYTATTGALTFAPGVTSQTVDVVAISSDEGAADRRFFVDFSVTSPAGVPGARAAVTLAWPAGFYTLTPCRLADTRTDAPAGGGPALDAGAVRRIAAAGRCGIPDTAKAVAANVTVTGATDAGDLRVFAAGLATPETSVVNYGAGQTRAAFALVALGPDGEIDAFSGQATGTAHLVLDVAGYFK